MTKTEIRSTVSSLTGETDNGVLTFFIQKAEDAVLAKCFPFRQDKRDVPVRYHTTVVNIAVYLLNKRGAEGEISHSENGIGRTYESADIPDSMLKSVVSFCSPFSVG